MCCFNAQLLCYPEKSCDKSRFDHCFLHGNPTKKQVLLERLNLGCWF
ncbi:hypothetical protein DTO96_101234 [Ephemeroptericola cinctiostellae]|uniref:Uncharacterized protein n=1 Tax=Ephemeroptericola cinctiostellae TaxID=2268024 RepID=A0A345DAW5_9BURK|nr:hypothetical protein DTO96_101234 [Ephemeroptericola cinctiostellae]